MPSWKKWVEGPVHQKNHHHFHLASNSAYFSVGGGCNMPTSCYFCAISFASHVEDHADSFAMGRGRDVSGIFT